MPGGEPIGADAKAIVDAIAQLKIAVESLNPDPRGGADAADHPGGPLDRRPGTSTARGHHGALRLDAQRGPRPRLAGRPREVRVLRAGADTSGPPHGNGKVRRRVLMYACAARRTGACTNRVELAETLVDAAVLEALAAALSPRTLEAAVEQAVADMRAAQVGHVRRSSGNCRRCAR